MSRLFQIEAATKIMVGICPKAKDNLETGLQGIRELIEDARELGIEFKEEP
uniref:Uncharacterized protein n=1 Tax=viral metagenome TaxID=1070528 RepID=A0A6M3L4M4_9ZZZZ